MENQISAIFDISGSMNEMGKIHIQRNLCRFISQLHEVDGERYSGIQFGCYGWGSSVIEISIDESDDIPRLDAAGQLNFRALSDFLSKLSGEGGIRKLVILSDGHFDRDDLAGFIEWKTSYEHALIHTVAVGADANLFNLKKLSLDDGVFLAENIGTAINNIIWNSDTQTNPPESISQILLPQHPIAVEEWDV